MTMEFAKTLNNLTSNQSIFIIHNNLLNPSSVLYSTLQSVAIMISITVCNIITLSLYFRELMPSKYVPYNNWYL